MTHIIKFLFILILCCSATAADYSKRLGVGLSDHLVTEVPLISVKYHQDTKNAYSAVLGVDSTQEQSSYALGFKYYRNIFKEENINFYNSIGLSLLSYDNLSQEKETGYQLDWTFGAEFNFSALKSLGFSFEFGLSAVDYLDKTSIRTNANNILKSAIHFYL